MVIVALISGQWEQAYDGSTRNLRAIFQHHHHDLAIEHMPSLLLPQKGQFGLTDYEKIFCAPLKDGPDIYDRRGIDRERGALVIVRPDQYIAHILDLEAHDEIIGFLTGFLKPHPPRTP